MKKCKQVLSIFLALLMLVMSVPLAFAEGESCPPHNNLTHYAEREIKDTNGNSNVEFWFCEDCCRYFADAEATQERTYEQVFCIPCPHTHMQHINAYQSAFCGSPGNIEYWQCTDCWNYFEDEAAQKPLTYEETQTAPVNAAHDFLYDVGFEENPNEAWLSVNIWTDAKSYCDHGMSYRDYLASQGGGVTAKYCSHCGVVIEEKNGQWTSTSHPGGTYYLHEPGEVCTHEPEPGSNYSPIGHMVGATVALCGTNQVKDYWFCDKCHLAFADREATQPVTASQLVLTSPYAAHNFKYNVGFEDKGNDEVWLGTTSSVEASCQKNYGMTVAERFASEGYTAQYCENCGVVIKSAQGEELRTRNLFDFDLFVCPIHELDGAVKLPTSPEGLATGEKWAGIANYYNAVFAFTPHPEGEDGFMMLILTLAFILADDYYFNETTQKLFSLDQYGEVQSMPPVFLRTVGDEENAIALPSSSEGLAVGEKWFDAASFYQDLLAKYESLPDADANQEMIEAFASQLAAAQIYLSPDGSVVYAKGCTAEIAEYLEDEGAPTDELAAMLNGGNWFLPLNVFFQFEEGDMILNTLDYVKTVEGGACAHVWNDGVVTKNATCTEAGIRTYTCTLCSTPREEIIPALGHDWDGGKVDKEPTITETGVCIYTCNRCKTTKSVTVPKMDPTPLVNELNGQKSLKDIVDDGTVFFEDEANLPADTVFDYEILAQSKYLQVFDLTLTSGGKKVEPEAPVWVKLPIPQGWNPNWISVWHGDEKLPSFAEGGYVYFLTTHFSEFQVKYEEQKPEEPKPDNNDNNDNTNNQPSGKVCKFCGQVHTGFFQKIIGFFHSILALFGLKKK